MGGAPLGPGLCLPQALRGCPLLMPLTPALGRQDYSKSAPAEREETQFHVGLACCPFEKEVETAAAWRSVPGRGARFSSLEQAELGAGLYPQDPWIALRLENLSLCLYFSGLICVVFPKSSSSSFFSLSKHMQLLERRLHLSLAAHVTRLSMRWGVSALCVRSRLSLWPLSSGLDRGALLG